MKSLLLTGENNLINRPVFAGFYRSEIVFQPAGDRPDRSDLKFGPAGPDRFKNIGPVTTLWWPDHSNIGGCKKFLSEVVGVLKKATDF